MAVSREIRLLQNRWLAGNAWPQRLEWIEIEGIRGWTGQRIDLVSFPMVAIVGENGAGKSTVTQCLASAYRGSSIAETRYASDFFPDTPWERITQAFIRWSVREGNTSTTGSVRKFSSRWRGNPDRRERHVEYIDLSRIQPVLARVGYSRLAKPQYVEAASQPFDQAKLTRLSDVLGHQYDLAKMAVTNFDAKRSVPVISQQNIAYSGFHQGAGETMIAELIRKDIPRYSLVLIDEVETSLHPRAQRRLIRDLATLCRTQELQIVLTTHSPYVLEELPPEARLYILSRVEGRQVVRGVSPFFALTQMDEDQHPECDLYVEDDRAAEMLREILVRHDPEAIRRSSVVPFGAASVGLALGQMVAEHRFQRPSLVFLDGDQAGGPGCLLLPGGDAPERVVFADLSNAGWQGIAVRVGRAHADVVDACTQAMALANHHEWIGHAANQLVLGSQNLWQALCAEWATRCLPMDQALAVVQPVQEALA